MTSCKKHHELLPDAYLEWVQNKKNGLTNAKSIEEYGFELQYLTPEYSSLTETYTANGDEFKEEYQLALKEYKKYHRFNFTISRTDGNDFLKTNLSSTEEYYHKIQYFSSEMESRLYLISGTDTLDCIFSHFERNYGLSPSIKFSIAFLNKRNINTDLVFFYDDQLLGTGPVLFTIKEKDLNKVPSIKLK